MSRQLLNTPLIVNSPVAINITNYGGVVELVNESPFQLLVSGFVTDTLQPESQVGYANASYGGTLMVIPQNFLSIANPPATSLVVNVYDPGEIQPYSQVPLNRVTSLSPLTTGTTQRFDTTLNLGPGAGGPITEGTPNPAQIVYLESLSITAPPVATAAATTLTIAPAGIGGGQTFVFDIAVGPGLPLNLGRNFTPGQPQFPGGLKITIGNLTVASHLTYTGYYQ